MPVGSAAECGCGGFVDLDEAIAHVDDGAAVGVELGAHVESAVAVVAGEQPVAVAGAAVLLNRFPVTLLGDGEHPARSPYGPGPTICGSATGGVGELRPTSGGPTPAAAITADIPRRSHRAQRPRPHNVGVEVLRISTTLPSRIRMWVQ